MKQNTLQRFLLSIAFWGGLFFVLGTFLPWQTIAKEIGLPGNPNAIVVDHKQRGAHVFGLMDTTNFQPFKQTNLDWITLVSWGFQDDIDSPTVSHHHRDSLFYHQHDSSWVQRIQLVRAAGFKVFFKPHLWVHAPSLGKWRSDIYPTSDENWELWKDSYRDFIIRYAKVAQRGKADMYCIGVEFTRLTIEKPDFWLDLIREVRAVYSGKITYAANWYEEFEQITFWNELDYIGIQAYFPLTDQEYPSVDELSLGWESHIPAIEVIHKKYNRKVVFTEMGYRSTAKSGIKPWEWVENAAGTEHSYSAETQANCYRAFFDTVWEKEWFAGVHIWQLRPDFAEHIEESYLDFTPQGKLAEQVIAGGFE